jgi:hypothetical protein
MLSEETIKLIGFALAAWGALISTLLAGVKLWESFWKDRVKLDTSYSFIGLDDVPDEITVVNLTSIPVQVMSWALTWKPNLFHRKLGELDQTPDDVDGFTIPARGSHTLYFGDMDKLSWDHTISSNRTLKLMLFLYGRRRPIILKVFPKQSLKV